MSRADTSLPARGVWIEIHGHVIRRYPDESLPARGVWIEIGFGESEARQAGSLPARGVWIEIVWSCSTHHTCASRSPQGECGLKY